MSLSSRRSVDAKTLVSNMILENNGLTPTQKQTLLRTLKRSGRLPAQMPRDYQPVVGPSSDNPFPRGRPSYGPRKSEATIRREQALLALKEGETGRPVPSRPNLAAEKERYLMRLEAEALGLPKDAPTVLEATVPGGPLEVRGAKRLFKTRSSGSAAAAAAKENELELLANSIRQEIEERRAFLAEMERLGRADKYRREITIEIQERERELATVAQLAQEQQHG